MEGGRCGADAQEAKRRLILEDLQHRRGCINCVSEGSHCMPVQKPLQSSDDRRAPSFFPEASWKLPASSTRELRVHSPEFGDHLCGGVCV
jgi:hypothetical protein